MNRTNLRWTACGVLLFVVAVAGWWNWGTSHPPAIPPAPAVSTPASDGTTLTSMSDPALVFRKAFWRQPEAGDRILYAGRREWSTAKDGVRRWQWFIACRPGPQMLEWMTTNPFGLTPALPGFSLDTLENRPSWFPSSTTNLSISQNRGSNLIWLQSADKSVLYAADSGSGFAPPASKP